MKGTPTLELELLERCMSEFVRREPDTMVIDRPEILQLIAPSQPTVFKNGVYRFRVPSGRTDVEIDAALGRFAEHGLPSRWFVGPLSEPADLVNRLAKRGPDRIHLTDGLVFRTSDRLVPRASASGIQVEPLTEGAVDEFVEVESEAWRALDPRDQRATVGRQAREAIAAPDSRRFLIARINGVAVGTARLLLFTDGSAGYFAGGSVLTSARRKGVYRELIRARVELLRELGIPLALVHALRDSSGLICQKLGFQVICQSAVVYFK